MEECDSTSAHYNGDLSPDTLLIIGVKGASDRVARAPFSLPWPVELSQCPEGWISGTRRSLHVVQPVGRSDCRSMSTPWSRTFQSKSSPRRVAINQRASNTAIEISRIGAVMRLRPPPAHGLVPLEETLESSGRSHCPRRIPNSAVMGASGWRRSCKGVVSSMILHLKRSAG